MEYRFGNVVECQRPNITCQNCRQSIPVGQPQRYEWEKKRWWCIDCADECESTQEKAPAGTGADGSANARHFADSDALKSIANSLSELVYELKRFNDREEGIEDERPPAAQNVVPIQDDTRRRLDPETWCCDQKHLQWKSIKALAEITGAPGSIAFGLPSSLCEYQTIEDLRAEIGKNKAPAILKRQETRPEFWPYMEAYFDLRRSNESNRRYSGNGLPNFTKD